MLFIEIIACLGSAIEERCIGKSGQRREPLMRQKYKLVESVIMNNASCAPITHTYSRKSRLCTDTISAKEVEIAAVEGAEEGLQPVHCMQ